MSNVMVSGAQDLGSLRPNRDSNYKRKITDSSNCFHYKLKSVLSS